MLTANPAAVCGDAPLPLAAAPAPACAAWAPAGCAGGGCTACVPVAGAVKNACIDCAYTDGAGSADHATKPVGGRAAPRISMSLAASPYPMTQTKIFWATGHSGSMWTTFRV